MATTYRYDPASNRLLEEVTSGKSTAYSYLPSGQTSAAGTATYGYNDAGRLVGEYTPGGVMLREYVWLGDCVGGVLSHQVDATR